MQNRELDLLTATLISLLGVSANQLSEESDLLQMGLDSMGTMRAASRLRRAGVEVKFSDLIGKRTFGDWRKHLAGLPSRSTRRSSAAGPEPGAPAAAGEAFDLATMQHAFWVGSDDRQPYGGVAAHFYTEFDGGEIDPARLQSAVETLVRRHPQLRLAVTQDGRQRVLDATPELAFRIHDLRYLGEEACASRLEELRDRYSHQHYRRESGGVLMVALSRLPGARSRLHLDLDMIAGDAVSLRIILRELALLYADPDSLRPPPSLTYRAYRNGRALSESTEREQDRNWWRGRLDRLSPPPCLPLRAGHEGGMKPRVRRYYHWLDARDAERLHQSCIARGVTATAGLATLFAETVGRWSGAEPFLLNLPVFSRHGDDPEVDEVVGDFSSSVLINVEPTLEALEVRAAALQEALREAVAHSAYSGVEVLRDKMRGQDGQAALAPIVFTSAIGLGDLYERAVRDTFGEPAWAISQGPQVWIDAQVTDHSGGLLVNWDVRADAFVDGVAPAMFEYFRARLDALLREPDTWTEAPPALEPVEPVAPQRIVPPPTPEILSARFFDWAARKPEAPALLWGEDACLSYAALADQALRIAGYLVSRGIALGETVAVSMEKGPLQIAAVLGVLAAGATYVPCGVDMPLMRRTQIYERAGAKLVLVDAGPHDASTFEIAAVDRALSATPLGAPRAMPSEQAMYVIFTSGSTGTPKGVEVSHRAVANTVDAVNRRFAIGENDRTLTLSALDFDLSAYDIFAFLAFGASAVVVAESQRRDAHAWLDLIRRWRVNVISCVPALLDMLLIAAGTEPLSELRLVMLGGDRILPELARRWWAATRDANFAGLGGMTEAAIHSTAYLLPRDSGDWAAVPYGRPIDNMSCRVVDSLGQDCPAWVAGELWVSGPGLAIGYRGDPTRTAERFVMHAGRRWYRSGDQVRYRPDGVIEFIGRIDNQVKIRGHRIELGEVEAALMAHPAVLGAVAVVVAPVARQLCALVVLREAGRAGELRDWAQTRLPRYAVPEHIQVVPHFPLTANGKIDRKALAQRASQALRGESAPCEAPSGEMEQSVAEMWRSLLAAPNVARRDNFFALGGDSLIATRLMAALRRAGIAGHLADLFAKPELAEFCATLRRGVDIAEAAIQPEPAERFAPFSLTDIQRAFWIGRSPQMPLGGVGSHFYAEFDGEHLDVDRLERAWRMLVDRHDMLRAVVTAQGQQRVLETVPAYEIRRLELRGSDATPELSVLRETLSHTCYDPTAWPLFDLRAVRYQLDGAVRWRLFVSLDSMMLDGRSIMLIFTEWDCLYRDLGASLPNTSIQFRDYVSGYRRDPLKEAADRSYWQTRIATLPDAPALPLRCAPESVRESRFRRLSATLAPSRWQRFRERASRHGITPSVALAAAYSEILGYWSNQSEVAINLTLFDRPSCHDEIDSVVGDFASILLLGYQTAGAGSFEAAAHRLQREEGNGLSHRDVSGVWVLRELARQKAQPMATMPVVFTSVLGLPKDASMDLSPAFPRQVYGLTQTPQVWLDAKVAESRDGLSLEWDAVDALFPPHMLEQMFAAYCALIEHLADSDWRSPPELRLPAAQQACRAAINATEQDWPDPLPLYLRVFRRAQLEPAAPALVWGEAGVMDYATLAERALRVAGYLVAQGVQPGDRVAVTHPKGVDQIVAILGVLAAGGCYVPSGIDLPEARRTKVYATAGARLILTDDDSRSNLSWPDAPPVVPLSAALSAPALVAPIEQASEAPKYIIFTSGSTGEPKGVAVSHKAVANTVDAVAERFSLDSTDRTITLSALDFDLSSYDIFAFLSIGASVVVVPESQRREAAAWVEQIKHWRVTVISAVPALVEMIAIAAERPGLGPDLRLVMVGGDRVTRALPESLWRCAPRARFAALGGMTEAAIHSTCYEISRQEPDWPCAPYGRPLANMRCRVVDDHGRDCPDWTKGELWVAGRGLALGYHGDGARTREKFVEWAGDRWYRTGDLAYYREDGTLEFLGRADNQVKIRGHRIELAEVEGALAAHPDVEAAVAAVLPGAAAKQLCAALVARMPLDLTAIKASLRNVLPQYEVPEHLIQLEHFPLTRNGKIDRAAIASRFASSVGGEQPGRRRPNGAAEEALAALWSDLLGCRDIGADDNFFSLGGDSLVATRLMSRLQDIGYRGALADLFVHASLRAFAATLLAQEQPARVALRHDEANRYAPFPLTDVQQAYWLGRRPDFELGGIGAQCYVEYELPELDLPRLDRAWRALLERHDMLRCVMTDDGMQRILPQLPEAAPIVHDLRDGGPEALAALRETLATRMLSSGCGPLVEINVMRRAAAPSRLAIVFDNLVVDGLSMLTLLAEFFQYYEHPGRLLPPIGITFRDYAVARAQAGVSDRALEYWRERLADLPPAPALPTKMDPASLSRPCFTRLEARIPIERWARLTEKARAAGITPSVLLLTCFCEVLSQWSGQADLVVNLTLFDRPEQHADIRRVVGDFTSLILAAYRANAGECWLDRAARLQAQIWRDLDHQEVSAVRVLRELAARNQSQARPVPIVFTSMLGVVDSLAKETRWPDVTRSQTPQVWLDHQAIDLADGLLLSWDHVEALFPEGMIATMFEAYRRLLDALLDSDWQQPLVRALPAAQQAARERVNATACSPSNEDTGLHDAFFRQARRNPERRALLTPDREAIHYGDLARQALSIAATLIERAVAPGERVGVCCARGAEQIAAVLGVLAAGAGYVPINPSLPSHRRSAMCRKAGIRVVLTDRVSEFGEPIAQQIIREALQTPPLPAARRAAPDDLAYVIFTSGSTGEPKGVEIEHRAALNTIDDVCRRAGIGPDDVGLAVSALDFDLSVFDIFGLLGQGALLALTADEDRRDAERWLQLSTDAGVTIWNSVPALLEMVVALASARRVALSGLRLALLSGDWIATDLAARLAAVAPRANVLALGGATEASIWSNSWPVDSEPMTGWQSVPYGLPLRNQTFRVVDALGADAPDWVPGELWIGGRGVARGYCADPEQTARQFSGAYPQRWYRTGDIGRYRPGGLLEFLGRRDGQIKLRGHRVELGEIEQVLRRHPAVRQAVALVDGTGEAAQLFAFVEVHAAEAGGVHDWRTFLHAHLPIYAVPAEVVALPALPLNANGKVDRRRLAELRPQLAPGHLSLATGCAESIAGIWRGLLGHPPRSIHESFFAAGGNSLLGTRLVARVSERFGVALPLREFFANATIAGLQAAIDARLDDRLNTEEGSV